MKLRLVIIILLFPLMLSAQSVPTLTKNASIRIVTCGPGQELYSAFGHSAIRVTDPSLGIDYLYNYGVFDFDKPNFYLNFAKGYLYYQLARHEYNHFRDYYIRSNRSIHEQTVNLELSDLQKLFDYLEWNNLPENQEYRYDYFYDNCATRVRDVFVNVFGDKIDFNGSYVTTQYTIRDLTDLYLQDQPWGDLGIDICLGLPMDKTATPFMYMFLPDYIESGFNHASHRNKDTAHPLIQENTIIYSASPENEKSNLLTPAIVFWIFTFIGIIFTYLEYKQKSFYKLFDGIFFGVLGLLGIFLLLLWLATDHEAAAYNLNILWAFPFHLFYSILLFFKKESPFIYKYSSFMTFFMIGLACLWFFLPQKMHYALFPLVVLEIIRFGYMRYFIKSNKVNA